MLIEVLSQERYIMNETTIHNDATADRETKSLQPARAILWACAFVLAALVILQAGRLPGNPAYADGVSNGANYTVLTVPSGRGGGDEGPDDIIIVFDNRNGAILAYAPDARNANLTLLDGQSLDSLFRAALQR